MTTIRKTITLTDQQNVWVAEQIQAGYYTNDSECIRDLIRKEQERGLERLRQALIDGEKSGEPKPFDAAAFKQSRRRGRHG